MNRMEDLRYVTRKVLPDAKKGLNKNKILIFLAMVYSALYVAVVGLVFLLFGYGYISSIATEIIMAAVLSNYFYQVRIAMNGHVIEMQDLKEGFGVYFAPIFIFMIFYEILQFLISLLIIPFMAVAPLIGILFAGIISLVFLVIFNPIPEVLYITKRTSTDAAKKSIEFVRENPINWFVPNIVLVIIMGVVVFVFSSIFGIIFGRTQFFIFGSIAGILTNIISSGFLAFIMVYRGVLFDLLNTSNKRKREYQQKMYKK